MAKNDLLTRIEEVVLTAVAGVAGHAYGTSIFEECRKITGGRYISIGSIYTILDRLQKKGLVESWYGEDNDPACQSGKRCFRITAAGIEAIRESAELSRSLRLAWNTISIPLRQSGERQLRAKKASVGGKLETRSHRAG